MTRAYHFLRRDMTSGSGTEPAWTIGETRTFEGEIEMCERGYHSSPSWYDALQYAPGAMACIVEVSGNTQTDVDKRVSQTRKLIEARDATRVLRLFACDCAERVLPIFEKEHPSDNRPRQAIEVARRFANGEATEEERAAAWDAARDAAWATARDAAWDAAWATARDAARRWQKRKLNQYMRELFQGDNLDQHKTS